MKLALVVPGGFDPVDPANTIPALVNLAAELSSGHEVHVFAFGGPGPVTHYRSGGATVHQLGDAARVDPARFARNARLLARVGRQLTGELLRAGRAPTPFGVVHAFWANEPGFLAGLYAKAAGIPLVVSVGGGEITWLPDLAYGGAGSPLRRAMTSATLAMANELTAGSAFARSFLPRFSGAAAARTHVIPLGVPQHAFDGDISRAPGPPWRLLHVGSITPVKDHDLLLAAFSRVVAQLGDVTLDCVGQDTRHGTLQARARALGLDARIRFHGLLPNEEVAHLFRTAHLHVLSSRYESQAVVVLEAAAAGVPTVGTPVGLLPELSPHAAVAVLPANPALLGEAICRLLTDEARRRTMARAAQEFARTHDVAWTARTFEALYLKLREPAARAKGQGYDRDTLI